MKKSQQFLLRKHQSDSFKCIMLSLILGTLQIEDPPLEANSWEHPFCPKDQSFPPTWIQVLNPSPSLEQRVVRDRAVPVPQQCPGHPPQHSHGSFCSTHGDEKQPERCCCCCPSIPLPQAFPWTFVCVPSPRIRRRGLPQQKPAVEQAQRCASDGQEHLWGLCWALRTYVQVN